MTPCLPSLPRRSSINLRSSFLAVEADPSSACRAARFALCSHLPYQDPDPKTQLETSIAKSPDLDHVLRFRS